jgi:hypothetical protein
MRVKAMDLVGAISNLQTAQVNASVQVRVAKTILDTQRDQGDAAIKLIQAATQGVSQAGDALAARTTGLGGLLDTYA